MVNMMYLPKLFEEKNPEKLFALIEHYPLATLVSTDLSGVIQADVLPFLIERTQTGILLSSHIAKANPLIHYIDGQDVLLLFYGENGYISPNYYPSKKIHHRHVPTWNYQVVQIRGRVKVFQDTKSLLALLGHLVKKHEQHQPEPWKMKDAPKDYLQEELAHIVGIQIEPIEMIGKFKLSQNREPVDLQGVIDGLSEHHQSLANAVKDAND